MEIIRLATPEEVEAIAANSDLTPRTTVLTFGGKDFAVLRNCNELDPVFFSDTSNAQRRMLFVMNLETAMRLQGMTEYYFNVAESDEKWRHVIETNGAVPTTGKPEIRYKKVL